jgi:hypothetical protein
LKAAIDDMADRNARDIRDKTQEVTDISGKLQELTES